MSAEQSVSSRGFLPTVRRPSFAFSLEAVPRWWFGDDPLLTHSVNGLNLLFPEGERFFIRSVKAALPSLDDPELAERARRFFGQEAQHGRAHAAGAELLLAQGYDVRRQLHFYEEVFYPWLEPKLPLSLRLSGTVALEHLTATLGELALTDAFFDQACPEMRRLLRWHAAEELEHKSVAFDVFERTDGRYLVRMAGMAFALLGLFAFWRYFERALLAAEAARGTDLAAHRSAALTERQRELRRLVLRALADYARPGFHPDQRDNYHLARGFLAGLEGATP